MLGGSNVQKIYRDFISKEESDILLNTDEPRFSNIAGVNHNHTLEPSDPLFTSPDFTKIVGDIISKLREYFTFKVTENSYYSLEEKPGGHPIHQDCHDQGRMFNIGTSLILKDGSYGGDTYYCDDRNGTNARKIDRGIYDLVAHTWEQWHWISPSSGGRQSFLLFI